MSQVQPSRKLTARPGKGIETIELGCSIEEVRRVFGKPDTAKTYSDEIWWSFFDAGIDCGFRRVEKTLIALNFFRDGVADHREARVETEEGVGPGVSKLIVCQRLGKPYELGTAWTDRRNKWHRSWIKYSSGIAFEFGHDGKVDIMTIYPSSGPRSH